MSRGKKAQPDFVPAGTSEQRSEDPTDEKASPVDIGEDFTPVTDTNQWPPADPFEQ